MKVCIVAEGCYPYVVGGVSSWINSMIKAFPDIEFVVLAIVANRSYRGKFVYELPENVSEVYELYLEDYDWVEQEKNKKMHLRQNEYEALRSLLLNRNVEWDTLFTLFEKKNFSLNALLMGEDFLNAVRECYQLRYPQVVFSDFLWTMRSIYLPLFLTLKMELPEADLYHCVATGYAGVIGSMAKKRYGCGLMVSEHGIYTREREEELIRAKWVGGIYKNIWIEQFKKMSLLAYRYADQVTCLYKHAMELQIELGCPAEKIKITPNGIDDQRFVRCLEEERKEDDTINIGAVLRIAPIKDVKTMIRAFAYAKKEAPKLALWIMGPSDEEKEYAKECFELVDLLGVEDVIFTGKVDVTEYLGKMDMTILTSISEGQPLTILESFAAKKPVIATDVGNCRGLIYGEGDSFGEAGFITHIMNVEEIAAAMVDLACHREKRIGMGKNGYRRLKSRYLVEDMKETYRQIYRQFGDEGRVQGKKGDV